MITHISFDLDGTLISISSVELKLWYDVVPSLYAKKNGISFNEALNYCKGEYDKVGSSNLTWYDSERWFNILKLEQDWREVLGNLFKEGLLYPDALEALEKYSKTHELVLFTNTHKAGLAIKLEKTGLGKYFKHIVSAVSDLGFVKTEPEAYESLVEYLGIPKGNLLHVGDFIHHDYESAKKAGVKAVLIDRGVDHEVIKKMTGAARADPAHIITSLNEVDKFL